MGFHLCLTHRNHRNVIWEHMPRNISEDLARKEMIDPQLETAGWYLRDHSKVKIEITACPDALFGVDGYDAKPWNGVTDYCLYRENGEMLAAENK